MTNPHNMRSGEKKGAKKIAISTSLVGENLQNSPGGSYLFKVYVPYNLFVKCGGWVNLLNLLNFTKFTKFY